MEQTNYLMYVSNAGVFLHIGDKKILVDALCKTNSIYKNPTVETARKIIYGEAPFDNVDVMLISHHHEDHFDPESVASFVVNNRQATVIGSVKVISLIKKYVPDENTARLIGLDIQLHQKERLSVNGLDITAIWLLHDGAMFKDVVNLAYLIEGSRKILHTGDAVGNRQNYATLDLARENIDLLVAPFPYIGLSTPRQVIREYIQPAKIALMHMPYQERDSGGWIAATKKSYQTVADSMTEAVFLEEIGSILEL